MTEIRNLDWAELLTRLSEHATSELAKSELIKTKPLQTKNEAEEAIAQIFEFEQLVRGGIRPHMESLDLCANWQTRLNRNAVLKPLELRDVRHFCLETLALKELTQNINSPHIEQINSALMPAEEPLSAIDQILTAGGDIRSDASERLHNLNVEKSNLAKQIHNLLDKLVKNYQIEHLLQDKFVTTREGRWVLPIKSGMQHGFEGIVHDASQTKQTVFMEPKDIVPINNRLREVEIEIENEIERLLIELSHYLSGLRFEFEKTKMILLAADARFAQAQLTVEIEAKPPVFSTNTIKLKSIRHPILTLKHRGVVANTVELNSEHRLLLLSGPNAGGKTVLLKSIGLAAQMARSGLPICAEAGSEIPFFSNILASIGDAQSVDSNLSTFAAHLKALNLATQFKGLNSLLLIDEICGSTDPEEGAALARSFIDRYLQNEVYGVITSHLGSLKRAWNEQSGLINGSLDFDSARGPTYRFIMGVPGQSLAIQTAERAGVDAEIIASALKNLSPEVRKYQEAVKEIDRLKQDVLRTQELLNTELKQAEKERRKYEALLAQLESEKESLIDKEISKARKTIDEIIQQNQVKDVFARHEKLEQIKYDLPQVIKSPSQSLTPPRQSLQPTSADEFIKAFPPGTHIHITTLGRDGIIQGQPNAKGELPVLSNSMHLHISWRHLKPSAQKQNPTREALRKSRHFALSQADDDRVIDLRGLTSEEAISQLELHLDTASLAGEDRVKVIHGHGTNALKRSIRSYLSRSVYVKVWQAGTPETGGDGITWVEIK